MASTDFISVVREFFPNATDEEAMGILWGYTGYPSFYTGEPLDSCREQLQHLKDIGFEEADREMDDAWADTEALVAQRTEQTTPTGQVAGSIPAEGTDDMFFATPEFIQTANEVLRGELTVTSERHA